MKIAVLGGGSMGVAISAHLSQNGHEISIWSPMVNEVAQINQEKSLPDRLPGVTLSSAVLATEDIHKAVSGAKMIVAAVPSVHMRSTAKKLNSILEDRSAPVICCSKGLEDKTGLLLTEIIEQELDGNPVLALSGPSYAIEIALGMPTAVVIASRDLKTAELCQDVFMNKNFRVYTSNDIKGVELGGALKNVIALCAGISDGLGFGDNAKAALLTRGIAEISRLGSAMGADMQTFFGLTGMGDLILTCTGKHSRNKQAGILLGRGYNLEDALAEVKMVVEGVSAARPALLLAEKYSVDMPIIFEANRILYEGRDPREAVLELMGRNKKSEF